MPAHFGWHGLLLQHPEDWAPVALSGDRNSGYARLASPRTLSLQVRWAPAGGESLERALDRYLDRLARDARRKRASFSRETRKENGVLRYRYRGENDGEGLLFPTEDGRVAFLEAVGESNAARTRLIQRAQATFRTGSERWSVLNLDFTLPAPLRVEKKEFLSGRTVLALVGRDVRVRAERWGLAQSLLERMSLDEWARGLMGRGWTFAEDGPGLRGTRRAILSREQALVKHQPETNQITTLRVASRSESWRPQWDWLT